MSNDDDDEGRGQSVGVSGAQQADERQARPTARSNGKGGPAPRGRTPSEMLARKQRILSTSSSPTSTSDPLNDLLAPGNLLNVGATTTTATTSTAMEGVETKLESLSKILREHQQEESSTSSMGAQNNNNNNNNHSVKSIDDVYILLAKKEKDLQLAAELGKVLLERNDELSKQNEKITEEYSHKLELLEEDRHKLKQKLNLLDGEYENRLIELQTDCNILKNQLEKQQQVTKQVEKEKSRLIDDLVQQNQRLTSELVEATKSEELLSSQLEQVNERIQSRQSNRQDHVAQVDGLKEEDLERRLRLAQQDKSELSGQLDELGDKLLLLESLLNEKEANSGELLVEINELRDSSSWLSNKLELMISLNERLANVDERNGDLSSLRSSSERQRCQLIEQLKEFRFKRTSRMKANELMATNTTSSRLIDGRHRKRQFKTRRRTSSSTKTNGNKWTESDNDSRDELNEDDDDEEKDERHKTPEELLCDIFSLLRKFQLDLQQRKETIQLRSQSNGALSKQHQLSASNDDSGISTSEVDSSTADRQGHSDPGEWRRVLASLRSLIEDMPCSSCHLMIGERADYEQLQKLYAKLNDELRRKSDEALKFHSENIGLSAQLEATDERCRILSNDLEHCDSGKTKEEIVQLAWRARDEAVARKNAAEIGLAKTRIENMQISSQLMEVVQQKGELSQRLAQFEDDIHYITQHSVRAKFTWEEYAEQMRRSNSSTSANANHKQASNNLQSLTYGSINPLINQLLSFSSSKTDQLQSSLSPKHKNNNANQPSELYNNDKSHTEQPEPSLATKFTNKLNLTRFWQQRSPRQSPIKTIVENSS